MTYWIACYPNELIPILTKATIIRTLYHDKYLNKDNCLNNKTSQNKYNKSIANW